ncbi:hypothetical protein OUZ56_028714 [Daphnia magna]|uniref:Vacuolar protein-sorting-associated protein 25 n=1 Tax=Daphnia magna TaxID=35525 RepID=A0ABR0B4R4_9CRUS|nr:hypothetical protein OUZ56_028714 [Daphnia magna]
MEFSWPWEYDFPPFFTLQPNLDTQKKQLEAWRKLVIDYCHHNKIFVLDVQESIPLFQNKTIDRQLSSEGIKRVLEILQENNQIEWCDKSKKQCFVYWKTPQEWGNLIYCYIIDKGMTNTVCTFYELTEGDDVKNEEFAGLDKSMLLKALETLEASKKAEVIMFGVAYSSHGFWVKHHVHREKPNVSFKYQALLLARSPTSEITWSTFAEYNLLNSQYLHFPSITVSERDENDDGFMDGLDLKLEFESYETINFINMILIFSYRLKDISTINMESLGVIQYDSGIPLTGLHFVGDLQWVQKRMVEFRQTDNRYNQTIVRQFEISDLLRAYNARDCMQLKYYIVVRLKLLLFHTDGTELLNGHYLPIHGPSDGLVRIHTYIRYTEAMLEYAPGLWNVLKWAWIQK